MIKHGKLCKHCTASECKDKVQEGEADLMECPSCRGTGCENCVNGWIKLTGCHNETCNEMIDVSNLIDLFESGMPPVAGGSLDQTAWFIEAVTVLKSYNLEYRI